MNTDSQNPPDEDPRPDAPDARAGAEARTGAPSSDPGRRVPEPHQRRAWPLALLIGFLAFPARAWRKLVRRAEWGIPGVVAFGLALLLWCYVIATPIVMVWCNSFPEFSSSRVPQVSVAGETVAAPKVQADGVAYCDAILHVYDVAMRDNWLVNDRLAPTIFLDNRPSFQEGVLESLRYAVRVLRDSLSRQRSTDSIDEDIETAFARLNISSRAWMFPRAEAEYARGMKALRSYRDRLQAGKASFHPRADNLSEFLQQMNSLVGGANTRLLNCIPDSRARISEETAGDPTSSGENLVRTKVPWIEVDNAFFYSRGVAYVYRELMVAVNYDFREILEQRNADEFSHSIVVDFLNDTQIDPIYVANGRYGSLWANHLYQLLGLLSQVRERSRSLRSMVAIDDK